MTKADIGVDLRRLRQDAHLSQEELSIQSGVALSFIKSIELGHRQPSVTTVYKLAKALNTTPDKLIMPCWSRWIKVDHDI